MKLRETTMQTQERYHITRKASLISGLTNATLAVLKITVGMAGHSASLVADGLHSFSDLLSDGLVILASKAGSRAPDQDHPYGHRRIETFATIIIAIMLLSIAGVIFFEMFLRLIDHAQSPTPNYLVLIAALFSIVVNECLYRYNKHIGEKIRSKLLIANAAHNRGDALSSFVTLIATIGAISGLTLFDPIGATIIGIFIFHMGLKMIFESVNELIDTAAPPATIQKIHDIIQQCQNVIATHQIRTRLHGSNILIDCHIIVDPKISVSEGHFIGDQVKFKLMKEIPHITDATIHIDSEDDDNTESFNLPNRINVQKQLQKKCSHLPGINLIKHTYLHYLNESISIEIMLPLTLLEHHAAATLQEQYTEAVKSLDFIDDILLLYYT